MAQYPQLPAHFSIQIPVSNITYANHFHAAHQLSPPSPILELPAELLRQIGTYLDLPAYVALRRTCRATKCDLKRPSLLQLLVADESQWAKDRELWLCMECRRLRYISEFDFPITAGEGGRGGSDWRFCIECGLDPNSRVVGYVEGDSIQKSSGSTYVIRCEESWSEEKQCFITTKRLVDATSVLPNPVPISVEERNLFQVGFF